MYNITFVFIITIDILKIGAPEIIKKIVLLLFYCAVMYPNDTEKMANSVDPDQTPKGAVCSGSSLLAFLEENTPPKRSLL